MNFSIENDGVVVTAGATSANVQLPAGADAFEDIMIDNPTAIAIYVKAGRDNTVVATAASMRILPGEKSAYYKGNCRWLAYMAASGTPQFVVFPGRGS